MVCHHPELSLFCLPVKIVEETGRIQKLHLRAEFIVEYPVFPVGLHVKQGYQTVGGQEIVLRQGKFIEYVGDDRVCKIQIFLQVDSVCYFDHGGPASGIVLLEKRFLECKAFIVPEPVAYKRNF